MTFPGYDAWKLAGPDEVPEPEMEDCPACDGTGFMCDDAGEFRCPECEGTGVIEVEPEEPDGDYEYERRRDEREMQ